MRTPVLHRVVYGFEPEYKPDNDRKDYFIREWCKSNCSAAFYTSPDYLKEKFVEFTDDEDATLFALVHGNKGKRDGLI